MLILSVSLFFLFLFFFFLLFKFPLSDKRIIRQDSLVFSVIFFQFVYNSYIEKDLFTNEAFKAFDGEFEIKLFLGIPQAFVNAMYGRYRCMFDNRMKHVFFFKRAY